MPAHPGGPLGKEGRIEIEHLPQRRGHRDVQCYPLSIRVRVVHQLRADTLHRWEVFTDKLEGLVHGGHELVTIEKRLHIRHLFNQYAHGPAPEIQAVDRWARSLSQPQAPTTPQYHAAGKSVVVPAAASPERRGSELAYRALRGTGIAADVIAWPRSTLEQSTCVVTSFLPGTVVREGKPRYAM